MRIEPFALERFFAPYEFRVDHVLCASECETCSIDELLARSAGGLEDLAALRLGYSPIEGVPELRRLIAAAHADLAPDDVLVTSGAGDAIHVTMLALVNDGDRVVVVTPNYPAYTALARFHGCELIEQPIVPEGAGWTLDLEALRAALVGARALFVNFPNNPLGYLPDLDTWRSVVALAAEAGAKLISDEVFRGLEHEPARQLPSALELDPNAVVIDSMSKSSGLPGLRVGWLATRDAELLTHTLAFIDYSTRDSSAPSQLLAIEGLRQRARLLARNRHIALDNLDRLESFLAARADTLSWRAPRAGVVGLVDLLAEGASADALFQPLAEEYGVLIAPGSLFGLARNTFRIGFGYAGFAAGLARFEQALDDGLVERTLAAAVR